MAAALAAAERGMRVELFEQSKSLGGRASSLVDAETGEMIDYGQHVAMGCCSQLLDFCRRIGAKDPFERFSTLHFIAPDGTRYDMARSHWLPAPLHLLPGLWKLKYLTRREQWSIVRGLRQLTSRHETLASPLSASPTSASPTSAPSTSALSTSPLPTSASSNRMEGLGATARDEAIGAWLRRHGQSDRVIKQFWSPVLVSALGETVDYASTAAARHLFLAGFMASRGACDLLVPRTTLHELFHVHTSRRLAELGVQVHLASRIAGIEGAMENGHCRMTSICLRDGTQKPFDAVIVAVPWHTISSLLSDTLAAAVPALNDVERIESGAIASVHLWLNRPITKLPHAALIGRLGQWFFASPQVSQGDESRYHVQVVISAAHRLVHDSLEVLRTIVIDELHSIWPAAGKAKILHGRVILQPMAVFSMQPGVDALRPAQATPVHNLFLAGDWTSTGWPATMEGAVRSGRQAVKCLTQTLSFRSSGP
jgi:squalene-associated FAD-dependent desaturase